MCFMIHEILKYENIFILMEKMGKQYSQTPLKSPTMFRKNCVGVGEEGDLAVSLNTPGHPRTPQDVQISIINIIFW